MREPNVFGELGLGTSHILYFKKISFVPMRVFTDLSKPLPLNYSDLDPRIRNQIPGTGQHRTIRTLSAKTTFL